MTKQEENPSVAGDPEYERMKRRVLSVLPNAPERTDEFVLEDAGLKPSDNVDPGPLEEAIISALRTVYDPEIPLNIYDLGLIYELSVGDLGEVEVRMSLTAPGCPVAGPLVREVHDKVRSIEGVRHVKTELVWDPPWSRDRLSDAAKLELGLL